MTRRRLLWIVPLCLVVLAGLYTAWQAWQLQGDLRSAQDDARELKAAWQAQDGPAQERSAAGLREAAGSARDRADGAWWSALTHVPLVGDDARGVQALSRSLDIVATGAVDPLSEVVARLDGVVTNGRIDLDTVADVQAPVAAAHRALVDADEQLDGDSDGYVGALRTRYDEFSDLVHGLRAGLASAETATGVAPTMLGAGGPRDYLVIFQNNAEIRPTGGMPGSWALLRATNGKLEMLQQGTAGDFPRAARPVLPLSSEERAVYGPEIGLYFQDPGFTPHFPRAAELWRAHWALRSPDIPLDGVIALDPVAMSYLLDGTGPVSVGGETLTRDNAVETLLNKPYVSMDTAQQDAFFQEAARAVFEALTRALVSPIGFVEGLDRAASEGRLLVAAFDKEIERAISGTQVAGELSGDDGATPHIDVGLSDLTGSKMSYYLRYDGEVTATRCDGNAQQLSGAMTLRQVISPQDAARLPASVTGGGALGTDPGSQYVMVRVYGPWGGTLDRLRIDGRDLKDLEVKEIDGRPVASVDILLSSRRDRLITWQATTGEGQTGPGVLTMTPSVVPGLDRHMFASAC